MSNKIVRYKQNFVYLTVRSSQGLLYLIAVVSFTRSYGADDPAIHPPLPTLTIPTSSRNDCEKGMPRESGSFLFFKSCLTCV